MKRIFLIIALMVLLATSAYAGPFLPSGGGGGIWSGYALGTMTDGKACTYASTGKVFSCNSTLITTTMATDTLWDAAGDLAYGTGSNTGGRLAIGTGYQLLMTNSGATAPSWTSTLGATGTRLTKIWATDLEITNAPTINGAAWTTILQPLDADLTLLAGMTVDATANTVGITNGTAVFNVAAAATLNVDTSLTVQTGAVVLTGDSGGSSALVLPNGSVTLPVAVFEAPGAAGAFLCSDGSGGWDRCTTLSSSNSAAQFYDSSAPTKLMLIDPSGMTAGKTLTLKGAFDQSATIAFTNTGLSADSKTVTLTYGCTDDCTITYPATSATLARTDAGQTFTGVQAFTAPTVATSIAPASADGATLGTASYEFSDLYLADGGVIYFQNDQSVYLTPSASTLTLTGSFVTADVTNDNYIQITNNAGGRAPTASTYQLYPDAGTWKVNTNGSEETILHSANAEWLLSTTTISFAADADTTLYTVPTGKRCVLTKAIVVAAANANSTDLSIGADGSETDWVGPIQLDNLDAQYDSIVVMPVPNATPVKGKSYAAETVIQAKVENQAGAAGNTIYLFGFCY